MESLLSIIFQLKLAAKKILLGTPETHSRKAFSKIL